MSLLIDGHNLIGQMTDLALDDPEDEAKLVGRVRGFHARTGKKITVVFDRGLPGGTSRLSSSGVKVIFAPSNSSADRLILRRTRRHPHPAELTVVSSDREVIRAAQAVGAQTISSGEFARQLEGTPASPAPADPSLSPEEIEEWLRLFGQDPAER
jgi:predicted RNA-binding protein with PIN domain